MKEWYSCCVLCTVLLSGCQSKNTSTSKNETTLTSVSVVKTNATQPSTTDEETTGRHTHREVIMGMPFRITVQSKRPSATVTNDVRLAFNEIRTIESKMSEWLPHSEISRINQSSGAGSVAVSSETYDVVGFAKQLAHRSQGAFDPTWAAFRGVWQFKRPPFEIPTTARIEEARRRVDYRAITLDSKTLRVGLSKPDMQLGLGAIAKGYGIDTAADSLRQSGYANFIIDGGGDVYLAGKKDGSNAWRVGLKHPRRPRQFVGYVSAENMSVVTSGDYEHYFEKAGRRYHHILDVRTGYPATNTVSVTVVAPKATHADALATAVFVLGPKLGLELIKQYENIKVLVLTPDGEVHGYPNDFRQLFPARWDQQHGH